MRLFDISLQHRNAVAMWRLPDGGNRREKGSRKELFVRQTRKGLKMSIESVLNVKPSENGAPKPPVNEFDPASLRLSQDFASTIGVKKLRTTVPVKKPAKEWWVRVHPDPNYRLQTAVLELKEDNETYLVHPNLWSELATESTFSPRLLLTAVNRQNVVFLWPIRMPGADGRLDDWNRSALDAAAEAERNWIRVQSNRSLGAYETVVATAAIADPDWSRLLEEPLSKLLEIAFRDKFIRDTDHPVLRKLRGEA